METSKSLHKISNHPVHILDSGKFLSPSSFIPFCQFGKDMMLMGIANDNFSVPIFNSFISYVLNDQLCYQVDLNKFKDSFSSDNLKNGITFFVDMNEDRQFSWTNDIQLKNSGIKAMTNIFLNF